MVSFARLAENQGAAPLVVYLPARVGFLHPDHRMLNQIVTTLRARGINYVDLTSCLSALDVSELFIAGRPHYSPKGNARAAECLRPVVEALLRDRGDALAAAPVR
jgi:hypothetical protein